MTPLAEGLLWSSVAFVPVVAYMVALLIGADLPWFVTAGVVLIYGSAFVRALYCFWIKTGAYRTWRWP